MTRNSEGWLENQLKFFYRLSAKIFVKSAPDWHPCCELRVILSNYKRSSRQEGGTLLEKLDKTIKACDVCIFLMGPSYGHGPTVAESAAWSNPDKVDQPDYSYSQWEYILANRYGLPCLVFCVADGYRTENGEELQGDGRSKEQQLFMQREVMGKGKDRRFFDSYEYLTKSILTAIPVELASSQSIPVGQKGGTKKLNKANPYVGLRRFEEFDRGNFYGRQGLVASLIESVESEPLLLLTGHSGSGKSSVLRAGLVPNWRERQNGEGIVIVFTPDDDPFEGLYAGMRISSLDHDQFRWVKDGDVDVFGRLCEEGLPLPALVIVDQFEEIFTRETDDNRSKMAQFVASLVAAHRKDERGLRIVIAMRDDFYGNLENHRAICAILDSGGTTHKR